MSRNTAADIKENPAKRTLKWANIKKTKEVDGETIEVPGGGTFQFYDKETEKKINLDLPFTFAVLNPDIVSFGGYDERNRRSVYSNEVKDKNHMVTLRHKQGVLLEFPKGKYKDNKDKIEGFGAKYTQVVYVAILGANGSWEVQRLALSGAALSGATDREDKKEDEKLDGWFNFTSAIKNKIYSNFIEVKTYKNKKKGTTKFTIPVYELGKELTDKQMEDLKALDAELTEYLEYTWKSRTIAEENIDDKVDDTSPFSEEEEEVHV